jgi:hypothetical protein
VDAAQAQADAKAAKAAARERRRCKCKCGFMACVQRLCGRHKTPVAVAAVAARSFARGGRGWWAFRKVGAVAY